MRIENWEEGKTYSEMDVVKILGRSHVLIDPDRRSNTSHSPITTKSIPLRREVFENKVKKRSNVDLMLKILSEFPDNSEDMKRVWRKL